MKNSKELCHPLRMPFAFFEIDSTETPFPAEGCVHYFAELLLAREGAVHVSLDEKETLLHPGEAVIICPGARHQVCAAEGEAPRVSVLRMDLDRMPALPDYAAGLKCIFTEAWRLRLPMRLSAEETRTMRLPETIDDCLREEEARLFAFDYTVVARLSLVCVQLIRFWLARGLVLPVREAKPDLIYSLSGYIQDHLKENLRVEDLAACCGLSYPWFAKKFREIYGISCKDYIEQIRVAQVEHYLLFTSMDLAKISEATGYADCSHMIKNFKRIMDITPGQYRLKKQR